MPQPKIIYEPDWIDVNTQLTAIGEDFGYLCEFTVRVERDRVAVYARVRVAGNYDADGVIVQAMATRPIKSRPNVAIMCFSTAQDCWRQLDAGTLATAARGITSDWNGRPHIARRSKAE